LSNPLVANDVRRFDEPAGGCATASPALNTVLT
jgi:hypothetical protein